MYQTPRLRPLPTALFTVLIAIPAFAQEPASAEAPTILPLLMRWTHILAAILLLGGTFFVRAIVIPAVRKGLPEETYGEVRAVIHARWRKVIPWLILAFLVSGFYNYLAVTRHAHADDPQYHMLFGIKFLLSLVIFTLASILISKRAWSSGIRAKAEQWLWVLFSLGVAVVLIAGYMKLMP